MMFHAMVERPETVCGSTARDGHALDPQGRGVDAVFALEIIGHGHGHEHIEQIAGDGDLTDRIGDLAILDPEPASPARAITCLQSAKWTTETTEAPRALRRSAWPCARRESSA